MILIKKKFEMLIAIASVTFKEWAAYRSHMMVSIFVGPAYYVVQYFIWIGVFSQKTTVGGFTLNQMLIYYGVTTLLNYCIMDFADWNLQNHVHRGTFVIFMIRPLFHRFYALSQKIGHRFLGILIEFIPIYLILWLGFGIKLIPVNFIYAIISIIFAFLINFYINYSIGVIGFWMIKNNGVRSIIHLIKNIFAGVFIPLTFFPDFVQKVLYFLPFQYITYVPVSIFIGEFKLAGNVVPIPTILLYQGGMVILSALLSRIIYYLGIKK